MLSPNKIGVKSVRSENSISPDSFQMLTPFHDSHLGIQRCLSIKNKQQTPKIYPVVPIPPQTNILLSQRKPSPVIFVQEKIVLQSSPKPKVTFNTAKASLLAENKSNAVKAPINLIRKQTNRINWHAVPVVNTYQVHQKPILPTRIQIHPKFRSSPVLLHKIRPPSPIYLPVKTVHNPPIRLKTLSPSKLIPIFLKEPTVFLPDVQIIPTATIIPIATNLQQVAKPQPTVLTRHDQQVQTQMDNVFLDDAILLRQFQLFMKNKLSKDYDQQQNDRHLDFLSDTTDHELKNQNSPT